jgi:hypothetical protein
VGNVNKLSLSLSLCLLSLFSLYLKAITVATLATSVAI